MVVPYEEGQLRRTPAGMVYVVLRPKHPHTRAGRSGRYATWYVALSIRATGATVIKEWDAYVRDEVLSRP